jgi:hypothetical protein
MVPLVPLQLEISNVDPIVKITDITEFNTVANLDLHCRSTVASHEL